MTSETIATFDKMPDIEPGPNFQVKEIIVAGDRGPCGGVNMAIETTFEVLGIVAGREPVYANNPPVHNDLISAEFKRLGLIIQPYIDQIPDNSVLVASAHGWSPQDKDLAARKKLLVIDATCQLVTRVERAARKAIEEGKHVIYVGSSNHPEPRGLLGALPSGGYTFINIEQQVPKLPPQVTVFGEDGQISIEVNLAKFAVLNQTTLSTIGVMGKIRELREENPDVEIPDPEGICYATKNRQEQARERLFSPSEPPIHGLVVVGSKNSHNSNELRNIGEHEAGIPSYLVDAPQKLPFDKFMPEMTRILVTSGASVLDPYLQNILTALMLRGATLSFIRSKEKKVKLDPKTGLPIIDERTGEVEYEERFFLGPDLDLVWRRYEKTNTVN